MFNWEKLSNPILELKDWSLKDACMIYHNGLFYIFTSAFNDQHSTVALLTTPDFIEYSDFLFHITGKELNAIGACSPSIHKADNKFVLTFNTWGQHYPILNQLFFMVSDDLENWSEPRPLAKNLTEKESCIDVALAFENHKWYVFWREISHVRTAVSESLERAWEFINDGLPKFYTEEYRDEYGKSITHENHQLLKIDGQWYILNTDYAPHHPWLYRMEGDPSKNESWLKWVEGRRLRVPSQRFNTIPQEILSSSEIENPRYFPVWDNEKSMQIVDGLDNAAFIADWRDLDGYFYMIYGGKNEIGKDDFRGTAGGGSHWPRGWNRLGLARSKDLQSWSPAGYSV